MLIVRVNAQNQTTGNTFRSFEYTIQNFFSENKARGQTYICINIVIIYTCNVEDKVGFSCSSREMFNFQIRI